MKRYHVTYMSRRNGMTYTCLIYAKNRGQAVSLAVAEHHAVRGTVSAVHVG
jgi:hypothetical protein